MTITARIIVNRDDEEIEVTVEGRVAFFGSHNPYEHGRKIGDWSIVDPPGFPLTEHEAARALEALTEAI